MAAAKPAEAEPKTQAAETPRKRGKLVLMISLVAVLLCGGGGAAAWYFLQPADPNAPPPEPKAKPAVFLPLETFTTNLLPQDGQPQYLQASITLKLEDDGVSERVKGRIPEIRNHILMLIAAKGSDELIPTAGKQKLAHEIGAGIAGIIDAPKPKSAPAKKPAAEEARAEGAESEAAGEAEAKAAAKPAAKPGPPDTARIEVLFTSFIIQ